MPSLKDFSLNTFPQLRLLVLLLKKNLILRKRHWFLTSVEVLLPVILFLIVAYGRANITGLKKEYVSETYKEPFYEEEIEPQLSIDKLQLWYAPYTQFTENLIEKVQERFQIPGQAVRNFRNREELLIAFTKNSSNPVAAIIFEETSERLSYDIGLYEKNLEWDTNKLFIPLIDEEDGAPMSHKISFSIEEFPEPAHVEDSRLNKLFVQFLPLVTICSFIFLCPAVLRRVGEEQHSGAKEHLKMVGVGPLIIWLGWYLHAVMNIIMFKYLIHYIPKMLNLIAN